MYEENSFEIRLRISSWLSDGLGPCAGGNAGGGAERAQWAMQRGGSPVKDRCFQAKRRKRHPEPRPKDGGYGYPPAVTVHPVNSDKHSTIGLK